MILINGTEIKPTHFPNGETKLEMLSYITKSYDIEMRYQDDRDLILLQFIVGHLNDHDRTKSTKKVLTCSCFPYSRMDRTCERQEVFTLKYVCKMINNMHFDKVIICEPHSNVVVALLDRVEVDNTLSGKLFKMFCIANSQKYHDNFTIVYPDSGQQKRMKENHSFEVACSSKDVKFTTFDKERDWTTGKIRGFKCSHGAENVKGRNCVIVDDICSKGGTFLGVAKELKRMGAKSVNLIVAFVEPTIEQGHLLDDDSPIDEIFCSNGIPNNVISQKIQKFDRRYI